MAIQGERTGEEKEKQILKEFLEGDTPKVLADRYDLELSSIYNILNRQGYSFKRQPVDKITQEKLIAEEISKKLLEVHSEFPDFDPRVSLSRLLKLIKPEKVMKCIKDPVKLDRALVERARTLVFFIINSLKSEEIENSTLNARIQILPILMDVACNKYPLQPENKEKVNVPQLTQNILICIDGIIKANPVVKQEIIDRLQGVKKATEEGRLPVLKEIENGKK